MYGDPFTLDIPAGAGRERMARYLADAARIYSRPPADMPAAKPAKPPDPDREFRTADDLAGAVFPVSKDVILATARKLKLGRKMGRTIVFSREDTQRLYQDIAPCRSKSSNRATTKPRTSTSGGRTSASEWTRAAALLNDESLMPSSSGSKARSSAASTRPRLIVDNKRRS
jgi:hypothetical protein